MEPNIPIAHKNIIMVCKTENLTFEMDIFGRVQTY